MNANTREGQKITNTPEQLLADQSTPCWARDIIRVALTKDCVDAANVLEVLAEAFGLAPTRSSRRARP